MQGRRRVETEVSSMVAQYCSGVSQRELASLFGYSTSAGISVAIEQFIRRYVPLLKIDPVTHRLKRQYGDRRALCHRALAAFMQTAEETEP
jgi:hypothetical protein